MVPRVAASRFHRNRLPCETPTSLAKLHANDTHGHAAGDEVIIRVARRLKHAIRADDLAARWGGEEFLILLPEQPLEGIVAVARKVLRAISDQPIGAQQHRVSASAGLALYPDHGLTPDELIRHADEALYHSKESGRNRYSLAHK